MASFLSIIIHSIVSSLEKRPHTINTGFTHVFNIHVEQIECLHDIVEKNIETSQNIYKSTFVMFCHINCTISQWHSNHQWIYMKPGHIDIGV